MQLGEFGPEGWRVEDHPFWAERSGQKVQAVRASWDLLKDSGGRSSDGRFVRPAEDHEVPVALQLDFAAGPVWFVAGIPQFPEVRGFFIPGDEIVVVLSADRMRAIGFAEDDFVVVNTPPAT